MSRTALLLAFAAIVSSGCRSVGPEVLVTLDDGQKLVGRLTTERFALETGMGELVFDTAIAGELGPIEGDTMKQSGRMVRLWLRNGSEFVGKWKRPSVEVLLHLGEKPRTIDVPIDKLKRLQFRGDPIWSDGAVFRVVTRQGDDFFVDVTRTRLPFTSDLGEFDPFLQEIDQLQPLDETKERWRISLGSGTVFNGALRQKRLDLRLAVGPEAIVLPIEAVSRMNKQRINDGVEFRGLGPHNVRLIKPQTDSSFYSNKQQKAAKERAQSQFLRPLKSGRK